MFLVDELRTIRDVVRFAYSAFAKSDIYYGHGTDNPYDEAVQLVLFELELPWDTPESMWAARLTRAEKAALASKIQRRIEQRIPLPYLTNKAWFFGHEFYVDERVLVPRSPIAELIENEFRPWLMVDCPESILDLCTGSGCIGLACAMQFASAQVDLLDISNDALDVARINIEKYGLEERVTTIQSDVFSGLEPQTSRYDLIVSNPPYVDAADLEAMPDEYKVEPALGLAAGHDGLDIVRHILREASNYLSDNGLMIVEVGNSWLALEQAYPDYPFTWVDFESGGHGVFVITKTELNGYSW